MPEPGGRADEPGQGALDQAAGSVVRADRRDGQVGEHDQRARPGAGPRGDPPGVAADVRAEPRPPGGQHAVRPGQDAGPTRPVRGRGDDPARSAAAGAGGARQRPEPGRRADQQGDDRDPAQVRRPPPPSTPTPRTSSPSGVGPPGWPRMSGSTASGCATRRSSGSATCTPPSR